ncbi:MAG: hypothetical protein AB2689_02145 [Candidatus Thiodiazotropha taylori]
MAYPFARMPGLGEFINRACQDYGAELRASKIGFEGPEGTVFPRYLFRIHDNNQYHATLPGCEESEILTPTIVRRLCKGLEIPLSDFGLSLSDDGWADVPQNKEE